MRLLLLGLAVTGCYHPAAATGVPCSSEGDCPGDQACNADHVCGVAAVDAHGHTPDGPIRDAAIDTPSAPSDAAALGPWGTPHELLALASMKFQTDATLSSDALEIYFSSDRNGDFDIFHAVRQAVDKPFGAPGAVAKVSSDGLREVSPDLMADGRTLYLARDSAGGGLDIYTYDVTMDHPPVVDHELSADNASDNNVTISADGLVAMVDRNDGEARDLFELRRSSTAASWGAARRCDELDSSVVDGAPALDEHGARVYFYSDRNTTNGTTDLYTAVRDPMTGTFGAPVPIAELNTTASEQSPWVSADNRRMVFTRGSQLFETTR